MPAATRTWRHAGGERRRQLCCGRGCQGVLAVILRRQGVRQVFDRRTASRRPLVSSAAAGAHPKVQHHAQQIIVFHRCDLSAADARKACPAATRPPKVAPLPAGPIQAREVVVQAVGQGCGRLASLVSCKELPVAHAGTALCRCNGSGSRQMALSLQVTLDSTTNTESE